jgi:hypothetical protein
MNHIKKSIFIIILLALVFSVPVFSFAQNNPQTSESSLSPQTGGAPQVTIVNPIEAKTITAFIKTILESVIKIGIPIVALAIIYSGFLFVSARGNPEKLKEAKRALTFTLIGAAILLGSWAIAQLISETILAL